MAVVQLERCRCLSAPSIRPQHPRPVRLRPVLRRQRAPCAALVVERPQHTLSTASSPCNSIVSAPGIGRSSLQLEEQRPSVPIYTLLSDEVCQASPQALRAGLKALKCVGVWGVALECWWGKIEAAGPSQYNWSCMDKVLRTAQEVGLRVRVVFCFHGNAKHTLPPWVLAQGQECPDIFYTDREGNRNTECLSLGVNDVPVLAGRTAVQAYSELLAAFGRRYGHLLGGTVTDAEIGLGPQGELRYPSSPSDSRWSFPGVGEFQCYDRFMLASLQACAQHVNQPHWGTGGPHDAGSYCKWPHQTGFFHTNGSWDSEYGSFFLQWYSGLLTRHADRVLGAASAALGGRGVRLHARLPLIHWWYKQAAHAAELTAGIYNTSERDGYLSILRMLARHRCGVAIAGAEAVASEQPTHAMSDPETLLLQVRAGAAALQLPVALGNLKPVCGARALAEVEAKAFSAASYRGVEVPPADALVFSALGDAMFEPDNWQAFQAWVGSVRARGAGTSGAADAALQPLAAPAPHAKQVHAAAGQPALAAQQQPQQLQQQPAPQLQLVSEAQPSAVLV